MYLTNNKVVIHQEEPLFQFFKENLIKFEDERRVPLYQKTRQGIEFGRGINFLLGDKLKGIQDLSVDTLEYNVSLNFQDYRNLLPGYTLREDQITTIIKALKYKRGIFQLATGSGKSLCIAGVMKYLQNQLGYCPTALLLEPTNYLVDDMCARMNSYGVPCKTYSYSRNSLDEECLYVSHPKSLYNDIRRRKGLLDSVKILIADESHHEHCRTWSFIYYHCNRLEFSLGFTAYLISTEKINNMSFGLLDSDEAKAIECTGPVRMNLDPSYYIDLGVLATPIVLRIDNPADEFVNDIRNWQELRVNRLESDYRRGLIVESAKIFCDKGFKILGLSATKDFAVSMLLDLHKLGISDKAACSFGGGEYVFINSEGLPEYTKDPIYKEKFNTGEVQILICTSHLFEGADIPHLDVVIMAEVGKKVRKIIQGVGRGLRKTKKGKYAYILDFTDHNSYVLKKHSNMRLEYYDSIVGAKQIFDYVSIRDLNTIIQRLES